MIGAKGKDAAAWGILFLFSLLILVLIINPQKEIVLCISAVQLVLGAAIIKHTLFEIPKCSRDRQLKVITLVPINPTWAKWLTGFKTVRAYEIHLDNKGDTLPLRQLIKTMDEDLAYIEENMEGLFLWETSIAVPKKIRNIIRKYEKEGRAVWEHGYWIPVILRKKKSKSRRGAILIGGS